MSKAIKLTDEELEKLVVGMKESSKKYLFCPSHPKHKSKSKDKK